MIIPTVLTISAQMIFPVFNLIPTVILGLNDKIIGENRLYICFCLDDYSKENSTE